MSNKFYLLTGMFLGLSACEGTYKETVFKDGSFEITAKEMNDGVSENQRARIEYFIGRSVGARKFRIVEIQKPVITSFTIDAPAEIVMICGKLSITGSSEDTFGFMTIENKATGKFGEFVYVDKKECGGINEKNGYEPKFTYEEIR